MKRTSQDYVADILACFQETQEFTKGLDYEAFTKDRKTVNAVVAVWRSWEKQQKGFLKIYAGNIRKFPGSG